jgi:hypothetical protein
MVMKIYWRWAMGTMAALLAGHAFAQYDNGYDYSNYSYNSGDRTFECRSTGYAATYCRVDTRFGITLVRQISTSACIQGRSWGFDDRGVWVSNGCQARFALGGRDDRYGGGYGNDYYAARVIRCESNDNRQTFCRADTRGGVQIARQLSSTYCQQGRNWNYDRSGVWVSGGCRADFSIGAYGNDYRPGYGDGQVVRCDSNGSRTVRCNADTRGGVSLVRRLSQASCIEGRNWGYDRYGIWVSGGCRGEFQTGGGRGRYDDDYQR